MNESPIATETLEAQAAEVSKLLRLVRKRAPLAVKQEARSALDELFRITEHGEGSIADRVRLARRLESLTRELQGRGDVRSGFYDGDRLGMVRTYNPIRIVGSIEHERIRRHFIRYESRARKSLARMRWFFRRCGIPVDDGPDLKPWELPYASFEEYHELLWGRIRRDYLDDEEGH